MPSISVPALIGGAATLGSAAISSAGANSAAQTQANAANQAQQTQLQMYNQTRSDLSPFMTTGTSALSTLANIFGLGPGGTGTPNAAAATSALTQFPGYQFGLQQGQQALDADSASRGLSLSGAQLQAAQKFGTNYAMQQAWNPYVSQLGSLASLGENAGAMVGNNGLQTGQGIAQTQMSAGSAAASGQLTQGNIWSQALNQGASQLSNWWPGASSGGSTMTMANAPADVSSAFDGLF